ncbi:MAG: sigma-70 family RNA polymerase sigma factor [Verrucomicrobiae bacterium]|nr:sigma-70 family RNA polymerase sigma factor [Verrucomicrobiae bacterium]
MLSPEKKAGATLDNVEAREDARLLEAIAGQDQQALAILYRRRGDLVYSFLLRMLGNSAEAQEVLQDTFLRLWRRAGEFDAGRSSATSWLLMLARGLALDKLRARSRRNSAYSAYGQEVASLEVEEINAAHRLEADELSGACRAALNNLPELQSRALQLAFFRGWTHEEIARAQGEALGTVKARIRRGLLALRKTMEDYYG